MTAVVDLFAGAGGIDLAARELGMDPLGIELDEAACATREAAGLRTLRADVAALDPLAVAAAMCGRAAQHIGDCEEADRCGNCDGTSAGIALDGLIGSPPCPTFSSAGRGAGRDLTDIILAAITDLADGRDTREERRREAYEALEVTARSDVLPRPRNARKLAQRAVSPAQAEAAGGRRAPPRHG